MMMMRHPNGDCNNSATMASSDNFCATTTSSDICECLGRIAELAGLPVDCYNPNEAMKLPPDPRELCARLESWLLSRLYESANNGAELSLNSDDCTNSESKSQPIHQTKQSLSLKKEKTSPSSSTATKVVHKSGSCNPHQKHNKNSIDDVNDDDEQCNKPPPRSLVGQNGFSGNEEIVAPIRSAFSALKEELTCAVCLEPFNSDTVTLSSCGHSFCRRCLMSFKSSNCPTCRCAFPPVPRSTFKSSRALSAAVDRLFDLRKTLTILLGDVTPEEGRRTLQPPDYVPDSKPSFF
jgi:hypothetical protein